MKNKDEYVHPFLERKMLRFIGTFVSLYFFKTDKCYWVGFVIT